jgi:hypothetical protein
MVPIRLMRWFYASRRYVRVISRSVATGRELPLSRGPDTADCGHVVNLDPSRSPIRIGTGSVRLPFGSHFAAR